jgi:protein-tyrosine-phosphatase
VPGPQVDLAEASLEFLRLAGEPVRWRLLRELGISSGDRRSKHLTTFTASRFDHVITLCGKVREVCPEFPGHPGYIHWSIADPAASGGDDQAILQAFRHLAAELSTRVGYLLAGLGALPGQAA